MQRMAHDVNDALRAAAKQFHFGCKLQPGVRHPEKSRALVLLCGLLCDLEQVVRVLAILLLDAAVVFFYPRHSWAPFLAGT